MTYRPTILFGVLELFKQQVLVNHTITGHSAMAIVILLFPSVSLMILLWVSLAL